MPLKISRSSNGSGSRDVPSCSTSSYLKGLGNLMEFLLSVSPTGDLLRQPGSLQIFVEGGMWKARLKDKQEGVYGFVSAETLDELLITVNECLESGKIDWRPDTPTGPPRGRK